MPEDSGFISKKPMSLLNQRLNPNFKGVFKSLGSAVFHFATGGWEKGIKSVAVDLPAELGIQEKEEVTAWELIINSLIEAMAEIITEYRDLFPKDLQTTEKSQKSLFEELDYSLKDYEITLRHSFFDKPHKIELLQEIEEFFKKWIVSFEISETESRNLCRRLPSYFTFKLIKRWRDDPKKYEALKKKLSTPFDTNEEKMLGWKHYRAWLIKETQGNLLTETFSLQDIYIPLRAYTVQSDDGFAENYEKKDKRKIRQVVNLHEEMDSWLHKNDKDDAMRIICGGPGSGKSSFSKIWGAQLAKEHRYVLWIPLHRVKIEKEFIPSLEEYLTFDQYLKHNPLDKEKGDYPIVLILDGLDEISSQGKVGLELAKDFVEEVHSTLDRLNAQKLRAQIVITGRDPVIQALHSRYLRDGRVLHVLPYYIAKEKSERDSQSIQYEGDTEILEVDQRDEWWQRYGELKGLDYSGLPKELKREQLEEVSCQPLLNYLLALSYAPQKISLDEESNINLIYKDLLRSIYERVWGDSQHPSAKDFEKEDYIQVLEEIAVSLWHRESRSASVTEMSARLEKTGLQEKFSQFKEGAEKPISRLLTAFYFRQRDEMRDGEERFEFTHKSFGEYLTARNIVRQVSNLFKMWDLNQEDSSLGWNSVDCLKKWVELSGSTALDWALYRFLGNEITQKDQNSLEKWQGMFCQLIGYMLRNGMPMEQCQLENYHEMSRQARNAEEGLLVVLSLCARETKKLSQIGWPSNTSFGEWLSRLVEQRKIKLLCLEALICLDLSLAFLYNANLRDANLVDANLSSAILISAILISANLISAKLMEADLSYANLSSANLISANLSDADLSDADLSSAILISADLSSANLSSANLSDAYLSDAYLSDANLFQTDIEGADFTDAKNLETVKNLHLARDLEKAVGIPEDLMKELMRKREAGVLDV